MGGAGGRDDRRGRRERWRTRESVHARSEPGGACRRCVQQDRDVPQGSSRPGQRHSHVLRAGIKRRGMLAGRGVDICTALS